MKTKFQNENDILMKKFRTNLELIVETFVQFSNSVENENPIFEYFRISKTRQFIIPVQYCVSFGNSDGMKIRKFIFYW